jgi:hypothetical protein
LEIEEDGEDNVKTILSRIGFEDGRWIELAQDLAEFRVLIFVVFNFRESYLVS